MNKTEELIDRLLQQARELGDKKQALVYELQRCDEITSYTLYEYRIESTARVIDFILNEYREGKLVSDLDTLLDHCLDKLHGKLDGVELNLEEHKRAESAVVLPLTTSETNQEEA